MSNAEVLGRFVWHELLTTDTAGAAAFYPKVLPWRTAPSSMPGYTIWMAGQAQIGGLMALPAALDAASSQAAAGERSAQALLEAAREAMTRFGKINVLVANAGGPPAGSALSLTDAQWEQAFHQNLMSAVWLIRGAVPSMKAQGGGRIITIITSGVKVPIPNLVLSNVFRSGVVALTKTLSLELAPYNILINNLAPGRIHTSRVRQLDEVTARASNRSVEDVERESLTAIPMGRYGQPREFANLAVFLASDPASYITGTTITIDGGATRAMQ